MAQRRYLDFSSELSQVNLQTFLNGLFPAGVYYGCDLNLDAATGMLSMAAGKYVTSTGMLVEETEKVDIGVLAGTSSGTSITKTILGLGPALNTIQRQSIEYYINDGVATIEDLEPLNQPYVILGFARFNGSVWSVQSIEKIQFDYSVKPNVPLKLPFPGVNGVIERAATSKRIVERKTIAASTRIVVPLNNPNPLKQVNIGCVDSSGGINVTVAVFTADLAEEAIGFGTVDSTGTLRLELELLSPGLIEACLVLICSSTGASGTILRLADLDYTQDATFYSL